MLRKHCLPSSLGRLDRVLARKGAQTHMLPALLLHPRGKCFPRGPHESSCTDVS